eukprot:Lankesteria_metandrocarpae@DN8073_c0_g1_i1.p1
MSNANLGHPAGFNSKYPRGATGVKIQQSGRHHNRDMRSGSCNKRYADEGISSFINDVNLSSDDAYRNRGDKVNTLNTPTATTDVRTGSVCFTGGIDHALRLESPSEVNEALRESHCGSDNHYCTKSNSGCVQGVCLEHASEYDGIKKDDCSTDGSTTLYSAIYSDQVKLDDHNKIATTIERDPFIPSSPQRQYDGTSHHNTSLQIDAANDVSIHTQMSTLKNEADINGNTANRATTSSTGVYSENVNYGDLNFDNSTTGIGTTDNPSVDSPNEDKLNPTVNGEDCSGMFVEGISATGSEPFAAEVAELKVEDCSSSTPEDGVYVKAGNYKNNGDDGDRRSGGSDIFGDAISSKVGTKDEASEVDSWPAPVVHREHRHTMTPTITGMAASRSDATYANTGSTSSGGEVDINGAADTEAGNQRALVGDQLDIDVCNFHTDANILNSDASTLHNPPRIPNTTTATADYLESLSPYLTTPPCIRHHPEDSSTSCTETGNEDNTIVEKKNTVSLAHNKVTTCATVWSSSEAPIAHSSDSCSTTVTAGSSRTMSPVAADRHIGKESSEFVVSLSMNTVEGDGNADGITYGGTEVDSKDNVTVTYYDGITSDDSITNCKVQHAESSDECVDGVCVVKSMDDSTSPRSLANSDHTAIGLLADVKSDEVVVGAYPNDTISGASQNTAAPRTGDATTGITHCNAMTTSPSATRAINSITGVLSGSGTIADRDSALLDQSHKAEGRCVLGEPHRQTDEELSGHRDRETNSETRLSGTVNSALQREPVDVTTTATATDTAAHGGTASSHDGQLHFTTKSILTPWKIIENHTSDHTEFDNFDIVCECNNGTGKCSAVPRIYISWQTVQKCFSRGLIPGFSPQQLRRYEERAASSAVTRCIRARRNAFANNHIPANPLQISSYMSDSAASTASSNAANNSTFQNSSGSRPSVPAMSGNVTVWNNPITNAAAEYSSGNPHHCSNSKLASIGNNSLYSTTAGVGGGGVVGFGRGNVSGNDAAHSRRTGGQLGVGYMNSIITQDNFNKSGSATTLLPGPMMRREHPTLASAYYQHQSSGNSTRTDAGRELGSSSSAHTTSAPTVNSLTLSPFGDANNTQGDHMITRQQNRIPIQQHMSDRSTVTACRSGHMINALNHNSHAPNNQRQVAQVQLTNSQQQQQHKHQYQHHLQRQLLQQQVTNAITCEANGVVTSVGDTNALVSVANRQMPNASIAQNSARGSSSIVVAKDVYGVVGDALGRSVGHFAGSGAPKRAHAHAHNTSSSSDGEGNVLCQPHPQIASPLQPS